MKVEASSVGPIHYQQDSEPKIFSENGQSENKKRENTSQAEQTQARRELSSDSVPSAWPQTGQGCLVGLEMNEDDLRDKNDFEAFSVTTYESKGKKSMENGILISEYAEARTLCD